MELTDARPFETTTYGVLIQDPPVERLCKNCRFWAMPSDNGLGKLVAYCDSNDVWEKVLKMVKADILFREDFGCIHFEQRDE